MRYINLETWSRRKHFEFFSGFDHPHFGMCAHVDLAAFYPFVKQHGYSLTIAIIYVISRAANAITAFRYRIRENKVVEHDTVNSGFTILVDDDVFSFCIVDYVRDFPTFAAKAAEQVAYVRAHPWVDLVAEDNVLYMTAIPWVSFTRMMHPMHLHPVADSVPRFAWGKFFRDGDALKMPLDVQGHHALMDGLHIGQFYEKVQDYLQQPEAVLGAA